MGKLLWHRSPAFAVFLKNKIGSCDAIMPVMLEAHGLNGGRPVDFITLERGTYEILRKNIVLFDAIQSIGRLVYMGNDKKGLSGWIAHRIKAVIFLGRLMLLGIFGRTKFIHFRELDHWPLRLLYFTNRRRTYRFDASAYGYPPHVRHFVESVKEMPFHRRRASGKIVAFDSNSESLENQIFKDAPRFIFDWPRTRKVWLDFVYKRADDYFAREFARAGIEPHDEVIAYIMVGTAPLQNLRHPDSLARLVGETLDLLIETAGGRPILMKPHFEEDVALFEREIAARPGAKIMVTHLHPAVLATRARLFVCNWFSTSMADGHQAGVPTIEFSEYADATLERANHGSFWPDFITHFINGDSEAFRRRVIEILDKPRPANRLIGKVGDTGGLLAHLAS